MEKRFTPKLNNDNDASVGGTIVKVVLLLFVLFILFYYNTRLMDFLVRGLEDYENIPEYSDFTIDRVLTISSTNVPVKAMLTIPYPDTISVVDADGNTHTIQKIEGVRAQPSWTRLETDRWGDKTMVWEINLKAGEKMDIIITYTFRAYSMQWNINSGDSGTVDDIPDNLVRQYCHNEWYLDEQENMTWNGLGWRICPDNETISSLAHSLADSKTSVYSKLKALYDYLHDNLEYKTGNSGLPKNCIQTLEDGTGDCDDQSIVFISMARALGIPAWLEAGALYNYKSSKDLNADGISDDWEGHAWANVYIPLKGGNSMIATVDVVNDLFLLRDTNRFSEWVDTGNTQRLEDYYTLWQYTYSGTGVSPDVHYSEYYITEEWSAHGSRDDILRI